MTLRTGNRNSDTAKLPGFTLVELLLVLTLLTVVIAVAAPSLSRFFHGRYVDSEAQRFLELTRYASNRAVAEGIPMILWVNVHERTYGLHAEESFVESDSQASTFALADNVDLFVTLPEVVTQGNPTQELDRQAATVNRSPTEGLLEFRFLPNGVLGDDSPALIEICEKDRQDAAIHIAPNRSRLYYEIQPRTL